jgi:hypothetical protein
MGVRPLSQAWSAPVGTSLDGLDGWKSLGLVTDLTPVYVDEITPEVGYTTLAAWLEPRTVTVTFNLTPRTCRRLRRLARQLRTRERALNCAYRRRVLARRRRNRRNR